MIDAALRLEAPDCSTRLVKVPIPVPIPVPVPLPRASAHAAVSRAAQGRCGGFEAGGTATLVVHGQ